MSELCMDSEPVHGEPLAARLKHAFPRAFRYFARKMQISGAWRRTHKRGSEHSYSMVQAWYHSGIFSSQQSVENYRPGYPRYCALLATHKSFQLCRRFTQIRIRLLLYKQDKLSFLERQLEKVDAEETAVLFLGCHRRDGNKQRESLISEIDTALADYGIDRFNVLGSIKHANSSF